MSNVPLPATVLYVPRYPMETERLKLRPFNRGDVDAVFAYRSLPAVARYLFDDPMSHEECAEAVRLRAGQIAFAGEGDKILLAVERKADSRLIGEVSLIWRSIADEQAEIGYILHPEAQGQGHATEAAQALLGFAFGQVRLHRVYARCDARNAASAKVMARLGMREEAHLHEHAFVKGRWDEELIFSILDRDWSGAAA
ncbi:MAG TPA: GNAT family protein [Devosia sp.]|jgi:RimJ/RimL family protein N-acetyltransferase|nr:GNAT family protein [Devosia sp.]